jgi:anaerobic carbon-monoxide dehydrogenase iron sulfur subunit
MLVCSFMHGDECNYHDSRIQIASEEARGRHTPVLCHFCDDPPCAAACPVEALSKHPQTGAIAVDPELCTGCEACVSACPFNAMLFNPKNQRPFTCDLCRGNPECVKVCQLPEALVYA